MSSLILAGAALTAIGLLGRSIAKNIKPGQAAAMIDSFAGSKYYKGGFESVMTKREAGLILGISPSADKARVKQAHLKIMLLNHPDKGGSPYLATKINEAKDLLEKK